MPSRRGHSSLADKLDNHVKYNSRTDNVGELKLLYSKGSGHNRKYDFPVTITYKNTEGK